MPVEVRKGRDTIAFRTDEHPKRDATADGLAALRPTFKRDGTVTAGNSSGINDGAAALVLVEAARAEADGLPILARIVGYAHAGVDPSEMGMGPFPAVQRLLDRTGLAIDDFRRHRIQRGLRRPSLRGVAGAGLRPREAKSERGRRRARPPVGATGAILTVKAAYELERRGGGLALVTMCIGGGQGIALAIRR